MCVYVRQPQSQSTALQLSLGGLAAESKHSNDETKIPTESESAEGKYDNANHALDAEHAHASENNATGAVVDEIAERVSNVQIEVQRIKAKASKAKRK